jgi:hypothetical protein
MASKTLMKLMAPLLDWAAPRYQAAVGDVLRKHGLRYEDLYDPLLNQVWFSQTTVEGWACVQACQAFTSPY